jgi:hypothetical protein
VQNLDNIRATLLVELPQAGQLTTVEEFVEHQIGYLEQQIPAIDLKNQEVCSCPLPVPATCVADAACAD